MENKNGCLYIEDITFALKDINYNLERSEIEILMNAFNREADGSIQ